MAFQKHITREVFMSERICMLIDRSGKYYSVFESVIDQFVSPPFHHDACAVFNTAVFNQEMIERAEKNASDLTDDKLLQAAQAIMRLKDGELPTREDVIVLDTLYRFLKGTVAPHQYIHPSIDQAVVEDWIAELGLDREFPGYDWQELLDDRALFPTFVSAAMDMQHIPSMEEPALPTPEQNKLAGRYMSALASLSGIFPFGTLTPHEVADRFYRFSQVWEQGDCIALLPE